MSHPAPTITVITVCYNSAQTLARALRSVRDQTYRRVQHIVIDGGSSDETHSIVEGFKTSIACYLSEPDRGIYDAMNKGLERAEGNIICFLNADDFYATNTALERVATHMTEHNLDVLMGDVDFFHEGQPEKSVRRYRSDRFSPDRMAWGWQPAHPALFLTRDVVKRVGKFKANYRIAGDFDYIARVFLRQSLRYAHLPEVFVHMQTGGASTAGLKAKLLLNKEVLRACRENGIRTNIFKILSKYPAKLLELVRA